MIYNCDVSECDPPIYRTDVSRHSNLEAVAHLRVYMLAY